jgi:hypothetical protein
MGLDPRSCWGALAEGKLGASGQGEHAGFWEECCVNFTGAAFRDKVMGLELRSYSSGVLAELLQRGGQGPPKAAGL